MGGEDTDASGFRASVVMEGISLEIGSLCIVWLHPRLLGDQAGHITPLAGLELHWK
jgi:hypothetical protein